MEGLDLGGSDQGRFPRRLLAKNLVQSGRSGSALYSHWSVHTRQSGAKYSNGALQTPARSNCANIGWPNRLADNTVTFTGQRGAAIGGASNLPAC
jgi:hypothetical protein